MEKLKKVRTNIDWTLFASIALILLAGLLTMKSFPPAQAGGLMEGEFDFFSRQLIWIGISLIVFFSLSFIDFRFLRRTQIITLAYVLFSVFLLALLFFGDEIRGATSWMTLGSFSFQPTDFMKLILVILLAKYFSRRHVEIKQLKHIIISGIYALVPFILILLQPDFGSAIVIFLIWFGMTIVSGISKKHLLLILVIGILVAGFLWGFVLEPYQKARIVTFVSPLTDISDAGYNARQSMIAIGSGQLFGKGVGYGTQSRLRFLPEYETDFIFAAFAEEWGFVGAVILLGLFGIIIWRILKNALLGVSNFEMLFGIGIAIFLGAHMVINIGMNIGLLPVTGLPLPFMSYGGSHLLAEFAALGILMGMRRYRRAVHREDLKHEFLGI